MKRERSNRPGKDFVKAANILGKAGFQMLVGPAGSIYFIARFRNPLDLFLPFMYSHLKLSEASLIETVDGPMWRIVGVPR